MRVCRRAVLLLLVLPAFAQKRASAPRADGASTPLLVYPAKGRPAGGCAPLAVISHGAGGSEDGYRYLAEAMARDGFTAVVMGHRESGLASLRADMREHGILPGVEALVADPKAEQARLLDAGAALQWSAESCKAPFRVLLGHSMGAETVMLEAGARNLLGIASPPAGRDRFDAYVALSPEGPGIVFPEHAWGGIRKPMLVLTGTRDQSLKGGPRRARFRGAGLPGDRARKLPVDGGDRRRHPHELRRQRGRSGPCGADGDRHHRELPRGRPQRTLRLAAGRKWNDTQGEVKFRNTAAARGLLSRRTAIRSRGRWLLQLSS